MAPLSDSVAIAMSSLTMARATIDSTDLDEHPALTSESKILQILALAFSGFSVASSVLAFYWFIKMRRSFRHDLIMLLIQSDMFKALWFMVYPIVTFVNGPVNNHSAFCQVNGFFLSVGIEASDFSILMIAVHSALYIFRPNSSGGEGGLYPYRRYAYAIYLILPILLASLAFVSSTDIYVSDGTYCYLPVRPFWYRLALSWIPRYLIFIVILGVYASIYFYVRYKFKGFTGGGNSVPNENSNDVTRIKRPEIQERRSSLPPTPPLACHGLIPVSRHASANDVEVGKPSESIAENQRQDPFVRRGSVHQFMLLASFTSRVQPAIPTPSSELSVEDSDSFLGPSTPRPLPRYPDLLPASPQSSHSMDSSIPSRSRNTSWRDGFVHRFSPQPSAPPTHKPSIIDIFSILRRRPGDSDTSTPISQLRLTNSRGENLANAEMLRTRDKIRRQLRFLFIYPLVYIGMWIVPFISHVMQYDDRYAHEPPFVLTCVTTVCICMQAAVDCWLFSTREKPWRHIPDTHGGFWESLKFWTGWKGVSKRRVMRGPGKTREEMVTEARGAYRRREEEKAQRQIEVAAAGANRESGPKRGERSWWDNPGYDGPADTAPAKNMSPVKEEGNPLDFDDDGIVMKMSRPKDRQSIANSDSTLRNSDTSRSKELGEDVKSIEEENTPLNEKRESGIITTTPKK